MHVAVTLVGLNCRQFSSRLWRSRLFCWHEAFSIRWWSAWWRWSRQETPWWRWIPDWDPHACT